MNRIIKWTLTVLAVAAAAGLCVFLYSIPPLLTTPPEEFGRQMRESAPPVTGIADPAERAIAARGRYIVQTTGCIGCHAMSGSQGPDLSKYLAGGAVKLETAHGTFVSRNLTPDKDTGLGRRSDEDVKRVLRSGVFADSHAVTYTAMPWASYSNWSEEDRYAVLVYLRHLPPVRHATPEPVPGDSLSSPGVIERDYVWKDYGLK